MSRARTALLGGGATALLLATVITVGAVTDDGSGQAAAQVTCDDQPIQHAEVRNGEGYIAVAQRLGGTGGGTDVAYLRRQNAARATPQAFDTFSYKQCRLSVPAGPTTTLAATTTVVATTTQPSTTTSSTVAPTTTTTTTTMSTSTSTSTVAPTTTTTTTTTTTIPPPAGVQFVQTFDGNGGMDTINMGVWHRDPYSVETTQWEGDHDLACGNPATHRTVHKGSAVPAGGRNYPAGDQFYTCVDHLMEVVGDTSGYSVGWFSPKMTFSSVSQVDFSVNLTNLGDRKWWKIGVVSESLYNSTWNGSCCGAAPGFLFADNGSAGLPPLEGPGRLIATWGEDWPGHFGIGNDHHSALTGVTDDKATRHHVTLRDNGNGTVTFTLSPVNGGFAPNFTEPVSVTQAGSFPACPCKVVWYDHNYTPNKSSRPRVPNPYSWHVDDIVIR